MIRTEFTELCRILADHNDFGAFFLRDVKVGRVTPCAPGLASQTTVRTEWEVLPARRLMYQDCLDLRFFMPKMHVLNFVNSVNSV